MDKCKYRMQIFKFSVLMVIYLGTEDTLVCFMVSCVVFWQRRTKFSIIKHSNPTFGKTVRSSGKALNSSEMYPGCRING